MKIENIVTKRTSLMSSTLQAPRYEEFPWTFRDGTKLKFRLHNFEEKVEGKRYVDGEFISDWIQYL